MARVPQLLEFCRRHGLKMISVADLIRYRLQHERCVHRGPEGRILTEFGEFRTLLYTSDLSNASHICAGARRSCRDARTSWCACTPTVLTAICSAPRSATVRRSSATH